jgi:hypothetical protein
MSFLLVSDLDDTLKVSQTSDSLQTVFRGLFKKEAYAGMSTLYQELIGPKGEFLVISSSPRAIRGKIHRFLKKHQFPEHQIWLRDWLKQPKVREYKTKNFARLKTNFSGPFLIFGDDQEVDPEVFSEFQRENPELVLKIYIRRIRGRKLPKECFGFVTAFDIALQEFYEKRLKIPQVSRIAKSILDEPNDNLLIPHFSCLKEIEAPLECPATLGNLESRLTNRLREILQRGQSAKIPPKRLKDL